MTSTDLFLTQIRHLYGLPEKAPGTPDGLPARDLIALEARLGQPLPDVLRAYYQALGTCRPLNHACNQLLDVRNEVGLSEDGYLVFYEENQGVIVWGIAAADLAPPDPPVHARYPPATIWELDSPTLSGFLLTMAIYNGTLGGLPYHANCLEPLPPALLPYLEANYTELTGLTLQAQRTFTDNFDEVLGVSLNEQGQGTGLFVGTRHAGRFEHLLALLPPADWTYIVEQDEEE